MGMDGGGAVLRGARAHAAGGRLVIRERRVRLWRRISWDVARVQAAESEIVHRALAGGGDAVWHGFRERAEERVDHALRGFDVAAGDCCGRLRVDDGSARGDDFDRREEAGRCGDVFGEQAAEDVVDGRDGDRLDSVNVTGALRR